MVVTNSNIPPEYFWDELTFKEVNVIIDSITEKNRVVWEQTRWLGYIQAISNGATIKTPVDLIKFSWEHTEDSIEPIRDNRTKEEVRNSLIDIKNSLK